MKITYISITVPEKNHSPYVTVQSDDAYLAFEQDISYSMFETIADWADQRAKASHIIIGNDSGSWGGHITLSWLFEVKNA
jgi:hypothetical protein